MSTVNFIALVERYKEAALLHGEATESGDFRVANRAANIIYAVYAQLKEAGPQEQRLMLPLLGDAAPTVRLWAAMHALEFSPLEAERVLEMLVPEHRHIGLNAEVTLKEWRAGHFAWQRGAGSLK